MSTNHPPLIDALLRPGVLAGSGGEAELVETHLSWVLLAGEHAYKVKKPVDFGFVNFGTLERRRAFCEEELRLNRRFAPGLYLEVQAIRGRPDAPRLDGDGAPIEYMVKMRRFRREDELSALAREGRLTAGIVTALAAVVADFHARSAARPPDPAWGSAAQVLDHCMGNFRALAQAPLAADEHARLRALERWTQTEHARLAPSITARQAAGFVRECHGDLHLGNIVLLDGRPTPFDALEFNPSLRWTDVIAEIAFTMMDLEHHGHAGLARLFLDAWLERSGDFDGLALLPFMLVYRALVRAKVAALGAATAADPAQREPLLGTLRDYLALAERFAAPRPRALAITCGVSGSGKSRLALQLVQAGSWVRIRSDVERKRQAGLEAAQRAGAAPGEGLYAAQRTEDTYARLARLAHTVLDAGFPALVDATFLARRHRSRFRELAAGCGAGFCILAVDAPEPLLRERVQQRMLAAADPSDADVAVLEAQLRSREPLDDAERALAIAVDTAQPLDAAAIDRRLLERCAAGQARPARSEDPPGPA